jgi:hypothetical protein
MRSRSFAKASDRTLSATSRFRLPSCSRDCEKTATYPQPCQPSTTDIVYIFHVAETGHYR